MRRVVVATARGSKKDMQGRAKWWRARGHTTRVAQLKSGIWTLRVYKAG